MRKLACLVAIAGLPSAAQLRLSFKEAVDTALRTHPALGAARQRIEVASGFRTQAALAPNPRLVLQSENTRPSGNPRFNYWRDTDNFAYLQNTFETAGKRDRRRDLASVTVGRAELETELLRRQIASRVALAYWFAAGARSVHQLLLEDRKALEDIVQFHVARVREGAMAEADLIRVRLEAQRLSVTANIGHLEAERARIHMLREMGQTEFPDVSFLDSIDREPSAPVQGVDHALTERVEVKLARAAVNQATANQRLQFANSRPNFDLLLGYKRTGGLDTMVGGFQVDLPFINKNQGNLAAAEAEIRFAQSNLAATEALVRAEVQAAQTDYRIRLNEVIGSLRHALDQAGETNRIAEAAYRAGGSDLLRLLDARRVRIESQVDYSRALIELRQSESALRVALGIEP
jgi:outer membrane protein TolC